MMHHVKLLASEQFTLLDGLLAHWSLDEASGIRYDSHTSSYDLTDNNTVGQDLSGAVDEAALFNRLQTEYLSEAGLSIFSGSKSICGWVKCSEFRFSPIIWGWQNFSLTSSQFQSNHYRVYIQHDGGSSFKDTKATLLNPIPLNQWVFVYIQYDADLNEIGISVDDGVMQTTALGANVPTLTSTIFEVGSVGYSTASFNGSIDNVSLYSRILSATEITQHYNNGNGLRYSQY